MFTNKIQLVRVVKLNLVLFTKVGEKDIQAVVIMNLRINPIGRLLKVVKSFGKSLVAICMGNMKLQMIPIRSEEHTSELQSRGHLVCRLLLEKKKKTET